MRAVIAVTLLPLLLLTFACGDDDNEEEPGDDHQTSFEVFASGEYSGIEQSSAALFKIDSAERWQEFWQRHTSVSNPAPTLPAFEFGARMLLAVVDASRPSGGYSIEIRRIAETGNALQVDAVRREPGPNCVTPAVITQPFQIVSVERSDLPPLLSLTSEQYSC